MKRYSDRRQLRLISEISLTPLVDLVLVLLFIFVLAASLMRPEALLAQRTAALLPPGETAPTTSARLFIYKTGAIMLDGVHFARANLRSAVISLLARKPGVGIEVRAHRDLSVQQLADIMSLLAEAGAKKTAISTHADDL
jgi:biopolymer transport protein ExbD